MGAFLGHQNGVEIVKLLEQACEMGLFSVEYLLSLVENATFRLNDDHDIIDSYYSFDP